MARPNNGAQLIKGKTGKYEIRWTEKRRSRVVSTRTDDLQKAHQVFAGWLLEAEKHANARINPTVSSILDDYRHEHVDEQVLDQERALGIIDILNKELGDFQVADLSADRIHVYKKRRASGATNGRNVCDATIRRELVLLIAACNHARKQRRISADDMPVIKLPPQPPAKDMWLTPEEMAALLKQAEKTSEGKPRLSRIHRFVALAMETASRKTAILELQWSQVDLAAGVIHFQANGRRQKCKRRVAVPISNALMPILRLAYDERQNDLVMDTPYSIQHHFDDLIEATVKETKNERFKLISPHTLRHTWATQAARAGVELWQIAGVLGDSIATVSKNYLHHAPDHLKSAVNFRQEPVKQAEKQEKNPAQNPAQAPISALVLTDKNRQETSLYGVNHCR